MNTTHIYDPVDTALSEIRVLTILSSPSELVHCTLKHVRLDDWTAEYAAWRRDLGLDGDAETHAMWLHHWDTDELRDRPAGAVDLHRWRRDADKIPWKYMDDILGGRGIPQLLTRSGPALMSSDEARDLEEQAARAKGTFPCVPRFRWGDFEAVSYCWESEERERQIVLDGHLFPVPKNLEAMLQRLRKLPEVQQGMQLWIDALCIDQTNVREKNHQVVLMRSIYTKALGVLVWIGEDAECQVAVDYMASMTKAYDDSNMADADEDNPPPPELAFHDFDTWFKEVPWKAIYSLFSCNYWCRLWIIQELALNESLTLFLCGDRFFTRRMAMSTAEFCQLNDKRITPVIQKDDQWHSASSMYIAADRVLMLLSSAKTQSQEFVLQLGQTASCKDARDKVYGLLGLLPRRFSKEIAPNYRLAEHEVYLQMFRAMMFAGRLDHVLSWCFYDANSTLPSWIPDWKVASPRRHIQWLMRRGASGETASSWSVSPDGFRLDCAGIIIDKISSRSTSNQENLPYKTSKNCAAPQTSFEMQPNRYGSFKEVSAALQRTLLIDHPSKHVLISELALKNDGPPFLIGEVYWVDWTDLEHADPEDLQLFHFWRAMEPVASTAIEHWMAFDRFRQTNADLSIFGHPLRAFFPNMREYTREWSSYPCYFEDCAQPDGLPAKPEATLWPWPSSDRMRRPLSKGHEINVTICSLSLIGRRLLTTETGYLCLGPDVAKAGDVIAVLLGCAYPVVLRPKGDAYELLGECYVDGLMDGEAITAVEKGELQQVRLTLC